MSRMFYPVFYGRLPTLIRIWVGWSGIVCVVLPVLESLAEVKAIVKGAARLFEGMQYHSA